ncbi:MAG: glycosyltransferase family 2 protein [Planctomycetes bacterium]|nr:glycosyltransferase family 2 protein [Planctomycetota bacterium]
MKSVCAIIVAYNPGDYLPANITALKEQVGRVIIVDNGSSGASRNLLDAAGKTEDVQVIYNRANLGIAAALNIGIRYALEAGCDWIATFDQDSRVTPGFINTMLAAYQSCDYKDAVAVISPVYCNPVTGKHLSFGNCRTDPAQPFVEIEATMTSGNLLPARIFPKVGLFSEDFFIDFVDVEFCLRCLSRGFRIIEAQSAILHHAAGQSTQHRFLWQDILITHHSPLRVYYGTRNRIVLWKRHCLSRPGWVSRDMANLARQMLKIILYEKDVLKKFFSIITGAGHGIIGRMGRYE